YRLGDYLGCARDLEHVVKAHLQQAGQHAVDVGQVFELAIERGRGQRYLVWEIVNRGQRIGQRDLGVIGADAYAFAAVYASFADYRRLAVAYANGLGGTALQ